MKPGVVDSRNIAERRARVADALQLIDEILVVGAGESVPASNGTRARASRRTASGVPSHDIFPPIGGNVIPARARTAKARLASARAFAQTNCYRILGVDEALT